MPLWWYGKTWKHQVHGDTGLGSYGFVGVVPQSRHLGFAKKIDDSTKRGFLRFRADHAPESSTMWGQMHHYCPIQRLKGHRLTSKHSKVSFCFVTCASENVFTQITNLGGKAVIFSKEFCLRSFFKLRCANEVLVNPLNCMSVRCFTVCVPNRKMLSIFLQNSLCLFHFFAKQCNVGHCSSYTSCVANRVNLSKICCSCCPLDASNLHDREKDVPSVLS